MIRKAILFVDTNQTFDGTPVPLVKISGVPLLKRILLDARRAEIESLVVILDKPHARIEDILRDKKIATAPLFMTGEDWQSDAINKRDESAIVLTADRLYDFRLLAALHKARLENHKALVGVDLKQSGAVHEAEQRYTVYDGRIVEDDLVSPEHAESTVGAFVFNRETLEHVVNLTAAQRIEYARSLVEKGDAARFDIGNGFVQKIESRVDVRSAEQRIIRYIWKETDGFHARWNKKVALPVIKLLLKTPITPNMISVGGVFVSLAAGYFFLQGAYLYFIAGAVLSYISALFDHLDGSVARLKSMESAFGCYFEQVCDFAFYFSFAVGITGGLYRETGNPFYLTLGGALLFGTLVSLFTLSYQRKEFAKNPSQLAGQAHRTFEANKQNPIYRFGRTTYFVVKRPVLPYYLFILTALGMLPVVLFIAALGANLFWMIQLYSNRLFRSRAETNFSS
jgi:phosphatidylglycerophosphate synthase/choline kinase